jgi:MFS family permease
MQPARSTWSTEVVVSAGVVILGLVIITTGGVHRLSTLAPVMLIGGAAWVVFFSLINALVPNLAPDWVRARVLAIFILVYQGSFALGSVAWGALAQRAGVRVALLYAGIGTVGTMLFVLFAKLPDTTADLSPWIHWRTPITDKELASDLDRGPVLVTTEYTVNPEQGELFVEAIHELGRLRRRDGAYWWGIFRDTEVPDVYLETFLVDSWAEHLRQHQRETQADRELERRLSSYVVGEPKVHHLIYTYPKET